MTPHQFLLRVYYDDTDAQGIVYHGHYVRFMDHARTEMLRDAGINQTELLATEGGYFVAGELTMRYHASARLDDQLIVNSRVTNMGNASVKIRQNIYKRVASIDSLLLEGTITLIYIAQSTGKPVRIPETLRKALLPYHVIEDENNAS